MPIDVNRLVGFAKLRVTLRIDMTSGEGKYIIEGWTTGQNPDVRVLSNYSITMGVDIPLHDVDVSIANMANEISSAAAAVGSVAEGGITSLGSAIGSITRLYEPHVSMTGGMPGSFLELAELGYPVLYYEHYLPANEDLTGVGRPLCQNVTLSGIPGFIKCMEGHIAIDDAFKPEIELIESYLVNGFYYE